MKTPDSESTIGQSQVGSQTVGAQSGAGQATQGAAAGTGAAQSGAGVQAQGALGQIETVADVGQSEGSINTQSQLITQINRLNQMLDAVSVDEANRRARLATDYDQAIRALNLVTLANAQGRANNQNGQMDHDSTRANDNAATTDKALDQVTVTALSENPIFQDAITAGVTKAMVNQIAAAAVK
jgi:hypothetical protein